MIKYFLEFPIFYLLIITLNYFDERPALPLICYVTLFFLILFFPTMIFEEDRKDGSLGLLLTSFKPRSIIIAKFCVKSTITLASMVICAIITNYFWHSSHHDPSHRPLWTTLETLPLIIYIGIFVDAISILLGSIYITLTSQERIIIYPALFVIIANLIIATIHCAVTLNILLLDLHGNLNCYGFNSDKPLVLFAFPTSVICLIVGCALAICVLYAASLIAPRYIDYIANDH